MSDATQDGFDSAFEEARAQEAAEAADRLKRGQAWDDWVKIGVFLNIGRNKAMLRAGTNEPIGARYIKAFSEWMSAYAWIGDIDKATRTHAVWCVDHLDELVKLRENMGLTQRLTCNHPTTMRRRWEKSQKEIDKPAPTGGKKESRADVIQRELEAVAAERDKWKHKAEKDGSLFDLKNDSTKIIAATIASNMSIYRLRELSKALQAEIDRVKAAQKQAG
jgi:uncharacterized protein YejL (UPF0352 family)